MQIFLSLLIPGTIYSSNAESRTSSLQVAGARQDTLNQSRVSTMSEPAEIKSRLGVVLFIESMVSSLTQIDPELAIDSFRRYTSCQVRSCFIKFKEIVGNMHNRHNSGYKTRTEFRRCVEEYRVKYRLTATSNCHKRWEEGLDKMIAELKAVTPPIGYSWLESYLECIKIRSTRMVERHRTKYVKSKDIILTQLDKACEKQLYPGEKTSIQYYRAMKKQFLALKDAIECEYVPAMRLVHREVHEDIENFRRSMQVSIVIQIKLLQLKGIGAEQVLVLLNKKSSSNGELTYAPAYRSVDHWLADCIDPHNSLVICLLSTIALFCTAVKEGNLETAYGLEVVLNESIIPALIAEVRLPCTALCIIEFLVKAVALSDPSSREIMERWLIVIFSFLIKNVTRVDMFEPILGTITIISEYVLNQGMDIDEELRRIVVSSSTPVLDWIGKRKFGAELKEVLQSTIELISMVEKIASSSSTTNE